MTMNIARVLTLLLLISVGCTQIAAEALSIPAEELDALQDLYDSAGGPSWIWSSTPGSGVPWDFSGNPQPCTSNDTYAWQGVLCSYSNSTLFTFNVRSISLVDHNLQGELVDSIGTFSKLIELVLSNNRVSGTIPPGIGDLLSVTSLDLSSNVMSGGIPNSITHLTKLNYLRLDGNKLDGTLPNSFSSLQSLLSFDLGENAFTGTMPSSWSSMANLQFFDLSNNEIVGTLPAQLENMISLLQFQVSGNELIGSIPDGLCYLPYLEVIFLDDNRLTGSIPPCLGDLSQLLYFDIGDNYLTRGLPNALGQLTGLQFLRTQLNYLTGTLPSSFGSLRELLSLNVYGNYLDGTIPTTLSLLSSLLEIQLNSNRFSGPATDIFNSTLQRSLLAVQLQENYFTGNIPVEPFKIPTLVSYTIGKNCFSGKFPEIVCNCRKLRNLVLDGLEAASVCQRKVLPGISSAYTTNSRQFGSIPSCYFSIPTLVSLHISGNDIPGTLPSDLVISPSLVDVSLSHNEFHGEIPRSIQNRAWYSLDLSFNRFNGVLSSEFGQPHNSTNFGVISYTDMDENYTSSLQLHNNRLSGKIPSIVRDMRKIDILKENIFSCDDQQKDLPRHDEDRGKYNCGSTVFDVPYYVWISLVGAVLISLAIARNFQEHLKPYLDIDVLVADAKRCVNVGHRIEYQSKLRTYNHVCDICWIVVKVSYACAFCCVLILAPLYVILSAFYGTHTYAYAWTVSAAFLGGPVPFSLMLVSFTILICFLLGFYARNLTYNHRDWRAVLTEREREELGVNKERKKLPKAGLWLRIVTYAPMVVSNFTVVFSANIIFVYIVLYQSTSALTIAQIVLSMFKLMWNKVGSRWISRWTADRISRKTYRFARSEFFALQLFIAVVNNIFIPCLVVLFTSPSCLYNLLTAKEPEESYYLSLSCADTEETACASYTPTIETSTYNPPFTYSYQCSASFITYYAAAFVNLCIFSGFGTPIVQFTLRHLYPYTVKGTWVQFFLKRLVPKLLRPPKPNLTEADMKMDIYRPFFDANQLLLTLLTNLAIMITFGVVFPPLAAAMAFTIVSVFYFARLKVGIFIDAAVTSNSSCYVEVVEKECQGVGFMPVLHRSIWQITAVSFVFYTWFLFDALGNSEGFMGSFWVFIIVPLSALIILPIHVYYRSDAYARGQQSKTDLSSSADNNTKSASTEVGCVEAVTSLEEENAIELSQIGDIHNIMHNP